MVSSYVLLFMVTTIVVKFQCSYIYIYIETCIFLPQKYKIIISWWYVVVWLIIDLFAYRLRILVYLVNCKMKTSMCLMEVEFL